VSSDDHVLIMELSIYFSAPVYTRNTTEFKVMQVRLKAVKKFHCVMYH